MGASSLAELCLNFGCNQLRITMHHWQQWQNNASSNIVVRPLSPHSLGPPIL
jgi:hypothetical protein